MNKYRWDEDSVKDFRDKLEKYGGAREWKDLKEKILQAS